MTSRRPDRRARETGFTLLELLVALTVFGFLMAGLTQGIRTGINLWNRQSNSVAATSELDAAARTLRNLLSTVPMSPAGSADPNAPPVPIGLTGKLVRLDLVGDLPNGFGSTQLADITIALRGSDLMLTWRPHRHQHGGPVPAAIETALLNGVARLQFAYWAPLAKGWLERWDGPTAPALIRVRLAFAEGAKRHWPDLIVAPLAWVPEL